MLVLHLLSSILLAGFIFYKIPALDIWYPWGILFHLLVLILTEEEVKFAVAFLLNCIFTLILTVVSLVNGHMTALLGVFIFLNLVMIAAQLHFRLYGVKHRWALILCVILIIPAGYTKQTAEAQPKTYSIVASEWFKPTSEVNRDLPNRHIISKYSMPMKDGDPGTVNAKVAAQLINHKILLPGETFSFNAAVGPRTTGRGFVPSSSYMVTETGETVSVPDIGGGICRTATILNKVVQEGGFTVVEQHSHSAPVEYADPGEDTAVAWPDLDYKFKNNKGMAIEIICKFENGQLTVELWGF